MSTTSQEKKSSTIHAVSAWCSEHDTAWVSGCDACAEAQAMMSTGPTERDRIEMCGDDPVRNEELGL